MHKKNLTPFEKRRMRIRTHIAKTRGDRLRFTVHRTNCHIYAQIIDDAKGHTVISASTLDKDLRTKIKATSNKAAAEQVGAEIAKRAINAGVKKVVFDRSGYIYHGRIKALAEAARAGGLDF